MKFVAFETEGKQGLAVHHDGQWLGLMEDDAEYPGGLDSLIAVSYTHLTLPTILRV